MDMNWFEFLLISLASFRLTRLIVFDKITEFLRAPFLKEETLINENGEQEIYYVPRQGLIRTFFGELLSCHWCTGIWSAAAIYAAYLFLPVYATPFIVILAIAGAAAIVETVVDLFIRE
jgi:hypothetical protein